MGFFGRAFGGGGESPVYEHCEWCGRPVRFGEDSVTVALSRERFDGDSVEVLESEVLLLLCAPCGERLDAGTLRRDLKARRPAS